MEGNLRIYYILAGNSACFLQLCDQISDIKVDAENYIGEVGLD